jgi:hypothetical protein
MIAKPEADPQLTQQRIRSILPPPQKSIAGSTAITELGSTVHENPTLLTDPEPVPIIANDGYQTVRQTVLLSVVLSEEVDAAFASEMSFLF